MGKLYIDQFNNGQFQTVMAKPGETVLQVLNEHGITIAGAVCQGAGICRGCLIEILEEQTEALACRTIIPERDLHIRLLSTSHRPVLLSESYQKGDGKSTPNDADRSLEDTYGFAVDLGTTTIAAALVSQSTHKVVWERGIMNHQAAYGADVISRIQYARSEQGLQRLTQLVREDIQFLYHTCMEETGCTDEIVCRTIAGNTTMLHLLYGCSVEGLSGYPFAPEFLDTRTLILDSMEFTLLPGRSAFVGADILAGVQYLSRSKENPASHAYRMLIDLGTNGELFLWNDAHAACTSTACGPAFANSIVGDGYETSYLDVLAELLESGYINQDGTLVEAYRERGFQSGSFWITQDSIRGIQLAKAAILTGIELLAYEIKVSLDDIDVVYLAGGFGFSLNVEHAIRLKLLPEEFRNKIQIVGNTALAGAILACNEPEYMTSLPKVFAESKVLELSNSKNFQEFFLHRLNF